MHLLSPNQIPLPRRGAQRAGWLQCKSNSQKATPKKRAREQFPSLRYYLSYPAKSLSQRAPHPSNQRPIKFPTLGGVPKGRGGCNAKATPKKRAREQHLTRACEQFPSLRYYLSYPAKSLSQRAPHPSTQRPIKFPSLGGVPKGRGGCNAKATPKKRAREQHLT